MVVLAFGRIALRVLTFVGVVLFITISRSRFLLSSAVATVPARQVYR